MRRRHKLREWRVCCTVPYRQRAMRQRDMLPRGLDVYHERRLFLRRPHLCWSLLSRWRYM